MGFTVQPPMNLIAYPLRLIKWSWHRFGRYKAERKCKDAVFEDKTEEGGCLGEAIDPQKNGRNERRDVQDRLHRRYMNAMEMRK